MSQPMNHPVNIGPNERRIRIWMGLILIGVAGLTTLSEWGTLAAFFLGIYAIYTGIHHFCPLWKMIGINTCDHQTENH